MPCLRALLRRAVLVALLGLPGAALASEVRLTLPEARGSAIRFLQQGRPDVALVLAEGVLIGAPGDVEALLLKSRALRDMGRPDEAGQAARTAFDGATNDRERFFSAMALAQAQSSTGRGLVAQYWLRRAADLAPEDHLRSVAVRDFQMVRRMTPSRLRLGFSLAPSDNLNDAPRGETLFWGPFAARLARPLSGVEAKVTVDYTYRIALGRDSRINLGAIYQGQRVTLSQEARRTDPTARDGDFAVDVWGASIGYERRAADGRWLARAQATQLRVIAASRPLSDISRLEASFGHALAPGLTGTLNLGLESERRHDSALKDALTRDIGLDLSQDLDHGTLSLALGASDVISDSPVVARSVQRAELGYRLARPVLGLLPGVSVSYEHTLFDQPWQPIWTERRDDRAWELDLTATLPGLSSHGFAPEIGVSFRDRSSNYVPYDMQGAQLKLGLKSIF